MTADKLPPGGGHPVSTGAQAIAALPFAVDNCQATKTATNDLFHL